MKKELEDAGLTVQWSLGNLKKLGEKMEDPKYAAVAKEINVMVLHWNDVVDSEGKLLPVGKQLPEQKQIEDADFKEDDDITTPTKIDD